MNPTNARRALYGKMAGDTTLNNLLASPAAGFTKAIYHQVAPQDASFPLVVFNKQAGTPTYAMATVAAYESDVWLIEAIDRNTSADQAEAVATRLNVLLTDGVLSISGSELLYLRRESDVDYQETEDGVIYRHVGSMFRLIADPA